MVNQSAILAGQDTKNENLDPNQLTNSKESPESSTSLVKNTTHSPRSPELSTSSSKNENISVKGVTYQDYSTQLDHPKGTPTGEGLYNTEAESTAFLANLDCAEYCPQDIASTEPNNISVKKSHYYSTTLDALAWCKQEIPTGEGPSTETKPTAPSAISNCEDYYPSELASIKPSS